MDHYNLPRLIDPDVEHLVPGDVKIISDSELKAVTTVIVIDDMFDTCGHSLHELWQLREG